MIISLRTKRRTTWTSPSTKTRSWWKMPRDSGIRSRSKVSTSPSTMITCPNTSTNSPAMLRTFMCVIRTYLSKQGTYWVLWALWTELPTKTSSSLSRSRKSITRVRLRRRSICWTTTLPTRSKPMVTSSATWTQGRSATSRTIRMTPSTLSWTAYSNWSATWSKGSLRSWSWCRTKWWSRNWTWSASRTVWSRKIFPITLRTHPLSPPTKVSSSPTKITLRKRRSKLTAARKVASATRWIRILKLKRRKVKMTKERLSSQTFWKT